ncbi:inovirus-type Gp2 protein [Psychrobacter frigidicola]|uniref:YagK/YfjJ domain-containing protein n=1 Tax=Psychrobacter frigidicola TaxID=45611 RepID=UPI00191B0E18|nr:inovirus-type Gp2 protein [Psychrobacter frigidicola]
MRKLTNKKTVFIDGMELPIITHDGKYECYVEPLEKIKRELDAMLSCHSKVFVFRLDIRVHSYSADNQVLTKFLTSYNEWLKRKYNLNRVAYAWCREVETAKKQHYHLLVMIDGNEVRAMKNVAEKAIEIGSIQNLSVWVPKSPSYFIRCKKLAAGDYSKYKLAFKRASYLAKARGKTIKGERAKSFHTSRINPCLNEHGEVFKAGDDYAKRVKPKRKKVVLNPEYLKKVADEKRDRQIIAQGKQDKIELDNLLDRMCRQDLSQGQDTSKLNIEF